MKKPPAIFKSAAIPLFLWLALFSFSAHAAIDNAGVLDNVLSRYQAAASTWQAVIAARATWLFWVLATISMVWTFGMMALRKADIGEFFAEFIRFTVTTGFFWWLLSNGPAMATGIMNSLRTIAANASGNPTTLTPSGIVDIGFDIFFKVLDQSSVWSPVDSAAGILISVVVLVILALVAVNMLILLVSGWILAYAGIFILGFGGAKWTSEMAIGYFKSVLGVALQLMTMVLLVGIGKSFVDQYYTAMSAGISLKELGVMLIERLQSSAQGATGQMQAIGYANQLASHQANQLLQIRGLLIAQQNVLATRDQALADREAKQDAAAALLRTGTYRASPAQSY